MSIRHRIGMRLKTLFVVSVLITTACSTEPATTSLPAVEPEELAAAAINRFQTEFGRQVIDAPRSVFPTISTSQPSRPDSTHHDR